MTFLAFLGPFFLHESLSLTISNFEFTSELAQTRFVFQRSSPRKSLLSLNNLIRRKQNFKSIQSFTIVQTTQSKTKIRVSKSFCLQNIFIASSPPLQSKSCQQYLKSILHFVSIQKKPNCLRNWMKIRLDDKKCMI